MASVVFSDLGSPWLNVRAGRFEPAYAAFSVKRHLTVTPYEIYDYAFPGGSPFSETQEGVEVTGQRRRLRLRRGLVNGSATNRPDDGPADVYGRATVDARRRRGPDRRAALRRDRLPRQRPSRCRRRRPADVLARRPRRQPQLAPAEPRGAVADRDRRPLAVGRHRRRGLVRLLRRAAPGSRWWSAWRSPATTRWSRPTAIDQDVTRWTGGARYYFADNLALHLEYSRRVTDVPGDDDPTEDLRGGPARLRLLSRSATAFPAGPRRDGVGALSLPE